MKIKISSKLQRFNFSLTILLLFTGILMSYQIKANQMIKSHLHNNYITYNSSMFNKKDLSDYLENELILYYVNLYANCAELPKLIQRSKYKIEHILNELKKNQLPKELVLLPIIESSYKSEAVSNKGATGLWQISYIAGKQYGLINISRSNKTIKDHRSDITAATEAALAYLKFLHKKFNNNWLFALAAYNAGETRINRALGKNKFLLTNIDYWKLKIPKETQHYVPKFLALAIIFNNPKQYGIIL